MQKLRTLLKKNPVTYNLSLGLFFLARRMLYRLKTFPQPTGFSSYDRLQNRRSLTNFVRNFPNMQTKETKGIRERMSGDERKHFPTTQAVGQIIPLSFSWPGPLPDINFSGWEDRSTFSKIIPGEPYSFSSYREYLNDYQSSKFAVTFKKGGWDCFRHIEILASGAIPFMPDIEDCPDWAMVHYPKELMSVAQYLIKSGQEPGVDLAKAHHEWFTAHLTSDAMARFLLERVGHQEGRVIFLDPDMDSIPDYLSVMTYVGLKRVWDPRSVLAPLGASPVFENWTGDSTVFHGLGFGYTKLLPLELMHPCEASHDSIDEALASINPSDFVIVANISRNMDLARRVNEMNLSPSKILFIWGDDLSPNRRERRIIKNLKGFKAFREIYQNPEVSTL